MRASSWRSASSCVVEVADRALGLRHAHVARVDLLLRQSGALFGRRKAGIELLAAVAHGGEVLVVLRELGGEPGDLALELGADLLQGGDVVLQAGDLAQLQLDLVLAGRDRALRLGELGFAGGEFLRGLVGLGGERGHLGRERVALGGHGGKVGR